MMMKIERNNNRFDQIKSWIHSLFCNESDKSVNFQTKQLLNQKFSDSCDIVSFSDSASAINHLDAIIKKQQGGYGDTLQEEFYQRI
ncbi:MAG: hypothetical protein A2821_02825 [Candidatus Magasanikbacteria bacterium RIFCSPHIGHO2_01_FULL_41_23]|uniref:Uncharacterized protein n=1 Tax=Candidatus Magasanikbacteria bacterium RIFCSPLOWO2_01_FULL_40_15 TaxID=1798686 RepID=A0A1F6N459_9BACT|nr:MAG: hypothetical protein A2821_02825 [Candidatus Magasanikbacteria bacterium RIFCSPHIGHO2_01_FULL_41_23]OGH67271.1 MAG: hypothetical protein A3C66_00840 [Candidatus Magasanikbacteria bacterium RIFCSPHIGHO2_02_FULL_41_35]OGH76496.1 MAG: hypothetical protein A3F22_00050 [Candidatus Magasanikbacteria bacterium RIFCSPHIGHO2_12_FULL_41_16]OGH78518.1 MAG: hypothetical protein A2983_03305 [Candidatus Magasanikbacteria bacterium RIFCSPLOWO2_01_FULL_40_15]